MADPNVDQNAVNQQVIATLQQIVQHLPANAAPPVAVTTDPHREDGPYNLRDRFGDSAYREAKQKITVEWDGTISKKMDFINSVRLKAEQCHWTANDPHGICTVNGKSLFHDYSKITLAEITTAKQARVDLRAIQNATAMFSSISAALTGNLRRQLFANVDEMPDTTDGVALYWSALHHSGGVTAESGFQSAQTLYSYSPKIHKFNIKQINVYLRGLFVDARSNGFESDAAKFMLTVNVYLKIKQPVQWVTFTDSVKRGHYNNNPIDTARLMNLAEETASSLQHNGYWSPSLNTAQEDMQNLVSLYAKQSEDKKEKATKNKSTSKKNSDDKSKKDLPPFITHTKTSLKADGKPYKVGDTKEWNGVTYHFCDYPDHKNKCHWHKFPASECRNRKKWIDSKNDTDQSSNNKITLSTEAKAQLASMLADSSVNDETKAFVGDILEKLE